jgi:hypothetical protein
LLLCLLMYLTQLQLVTKLVQQIGQQYKLLQEQLIGLQRKAELLHMHSEM